MPKKLYLVDISSYVFRAYFAIRGLKTSKGISTNATYGVITMLHKLIRDKKPDHLGIIFDSPTPTLRKEMYPAYKATRQVPPEDLPAQFDHIHQFVESYPLPYLEMPGYEADDIIATLIERYRKSTGNHLEVVIVSADKDLMQLIGPGVQMFDSMRDKMIAEPEVMEKFGVVPSQVADVLALMGDASDNIPGVKGIGGKTATKLIAEWGNLEKLLEHAEEIPGKIGEALKAHAEEARLSKKLVTLYADLDLKCDWDFFKLGEADEEKLQKLYRELELKTLIKGVEPVVGAIHELPLQQKYELILEEGDLNRWAKRLQNAKSGFAFDTETTGVDPFRDRLVGLSFSDAPGAACYIPVGHSYLGCPAQIPKDKILAAVKGPLEDPTLPKWAQNGKFDMEFLSREGITVRGLKEDSMIASYLINSEGAHNLDHLAMEYLGHKTTLYNEIVGKGMTFDQVELKTACHYSSEDADVTYRLVPKLREVLKKENLLDCYEKIEIPLVDVLFRMESHGVLVDVPYLRNLAEEFSGRMAKLEKEIYEAAGCEFNVQSPRQLAEILFNKLKLPTQRKIKTGYSTDADVLEVLGKLHPMPRILQEHSLISKLKSTYVDQLRNLVHPDGRIHTCYHQTVAATGRLSSSDPNLQNIPI
ncbi:MAG: DNA polymerase, partial [Deltaproteobacteria bacterium]|nr:DNA polymerase [Deltaproteobacteria bacterium]